MNSVSWEATMSRSGALDGVCPTSDKRRGLAMDMLIRASRIRLFCRCILTGEHCFSNGIAPCSSVEEGGGAPVLFRGCPPLFLARTPVASTHSTGGKAKTFDDTSSGKVAPGPKLPLSSAAAATQPAQLLSVLADSDDAALLQADSLISGVYALIQNFVPRLDAL